MIDERMQQAAYNNAVWCDTVCRAHGWAGEFYDEIWLQRHGSLPYYPNAVTLTAANLAAQDQAIRNLLATGLPGAWGVKDSFCTLDLTSLGFQPLFAATWLYRPAGLALPAAHIPGTHWRRVETASELIRWERAWRGAPDEANAGEPTPLFLSSLLADNCLVFLAGYQAHEMVAGAILNRTANVVGLSNVFVPSEASAAWWASCVAAAGEWFPGLPLVGYEQGAALDYARQCGFAALGPLRIWLKLGEAR